MSDKFALTPDGIRTKRLVVRHAVLSDLEAMHAVLSDPAATRYWSTPPHDSIAVTEKWLGGMIAGGGDDFVITLENRVIGKAGFFKDPEVGFILNQKFIGHGYAIEAVNAVCYRALYLRGLSELEADVDPRNARSLRLLGRLGFVEVGRKSGTWLIGDELCDSVYLKTNRAQFRLYESD